MKRAFLLRRVTHCRLYGLKKQWSQGWEWSPFNTLDMILFLHCGHLKVTLCCQRSPCPRLTRDWPRVTRVNSDLQIQSSMSYFRCTDVLNHKIFIFKHFGKYMNVFITRSCSLLSIVRLDFPDQALQQSACSLSICDCCILVTTIFIY